MRGGPTTKTMRRKIAQTAFLSPMGGTGQVTKRVRADSRSAAHPRMSTHCTVVEMAADAGFPALGRFQ